MKCMIKRFVLVFLVLLFAAAQVSAQEADKKQKPTVKDVIDLRFVAELGFLAVLDHRVKFGEGNQYFNYVTEGGQDNLYFNARLSIDMIILKRHVVTFLYQPLDIQTRSNFKRDVTFGDVDFNAGDEVDLRYSFPYYRLTYMYDFFPDDRLEVALGAGFQIRNATIEFTAADSSVQFVSSSVGFVPLIKFRTRYTFPSGFLLGTEIDGFYAPVSYLNGDDNDVEGLIVDWSVFTGFRWGDMEIYLAARYIGGGAQGKSDGDRYNSDGYTKNWLHFMTATIGVTYTLFE